MAHAENAAAPLSPPTLPTLVALDWVITVAGVAVVAIVGVRRLGIGRPDPLAAAPVRVHTLREDAVLVAVLAYLFAVLVLSGLTGIVADKNGAVRVGLVVNIGAQLTGIAACLWIASRRFAGGMRTFFVGSHDGNRVSGWMTASTATIVALAFCPLVHELTVWTIVCLDPTFVLTPHATIRALQEGGLSFAVVVALWIGAAVIAPVAEELFFRGILQNALVNLTQSRGAAIALAAVTFGVVHASQPDTMVALVFLGVLLGYAYERTGSLTVPIAIHAAFNLKTLVWDALGRTLA